MRANRGVDDSLTRERFWARVDKREPDDCWTWTGTCGSTGYGQTTFNSGRRCKAHRLAFAMTFGWWPPVVMHKCDNPKCVNPRHLMAGTMRDNFRDAVAKGRIKLVVVPVGEANHSSKLTAADVAEIREVWTLAQPSFVSLARRYGVHKSTIGRVVMRETWRHVA